MKQGKGYNIYGKKIIICAYRDWNKQLFKEKIFKLSDEFHLIDNKDELTIRRLREIDPEYIFFLDWSWLVPKDIFARYRCVVFHVAPLPEFRGGSPSQ
jgi:methionyl-tRNA formyltransferase